LKGKSGERPSYNSTPGCGGHEFAAAAKALHALSAQAKRIVQARKPTKSIESPSYFQLE